MSNIGVAENPEAQALANALSETKGVRSLNYAVTGNRQADFLSGLGTLMVSAGLTQEELVILLHAQYEIMMVDIQQRGQSLAQLTSRNNVLQHEVEQLRGLANRVPRPPDAFPPKSLPPSGSPKAIQQRADMLRGLAPLKPRE